MRTRNLVLAAAAVASIAIAPALATASVRMHMPHKRHHRGGDTSPTAGAPTSDIPDPIWTSTNTRR